MSYSVVSGGDIIEFIYSAEGFSEASVQLYRGGFNGSWVNDEPTLQSIGEALIPALNANTDPEADYALTGIFKHGSTEVAVV